MRSPAHVQHTPPGEAQESHREIRHERESRERQSGGGGQAGGLRGEGFGSTYICSHRPTNSRVDTPDTWAL